MGDRVAVRTRALTKVFRGFRAVDAVDLEVREGSVHALVGPNGAGKTTLFNLLTGFVSPTSGTITVFDEDVTGRAPEQVARRGVARSFQITSLFETLTSREHVELALGGHTGQGFRFWRSEKLLGRDRARVEDLLDQVGLMPQADKPVGLLAYGQKRALEKMDGRRHRIVRPSLEGNHRWRLRPQHQRVEDRLEHQRRAARAAYGECVIAGADRLRTEDDLG